MKYIKLISIVLGVGLLAAGCTKNNAPSNAVGPNNAVTQQPANAALASNQTPPNAAPKLGLPLSDALTRVTKKTFGLYVTPKNSPVSPEKFTGFHTGVDFETTPEEANTEVSVMAICDGKMLMKKYATGYGGVMVQSCKLDNADVTIVYGHLLLSSISKNAGDAITTGDKLGILGKGYSTETDGERKHLHLGIHKGTSINILGYAQKQSQLSDWLNALDYMK